MAAPAAIEENGRVIINLPKKTLVLEIKDFGNSDIQIEDLLKVDYANVIGDIITFPVIFNRIANIKAEIDNYLRESEFDMKAFKAQKYETHRKLLIGAGEKATETALEMAIQRDPETKIKTYDLLKIEKQAAIVDGLYWAAKMKGKMLEAISAKLSPSEFEKEILVDTINSVKITAQKNHFQQRQH